MVKKKKKKANEFLEIVKEEVRYKLDNTIMLLYKPMIHSYLDYCVTALLSFSSKSVVQLERGSKKDDNDNQGKKEWLLYKTE